MNKWITFDSTTDEAVEHMTGEFSIGKALLYRIEIESNRVRDESGCKKEDLRIFCSFKAVDELKKAGVLYPTDEAKLEVESLAMDSRVRRTPDMRIFSGQKVYAVYTLEANGEYQFQVVSS